MKKFKHGLRLIAVYMGAACVLTGCGGQKQDNTPAVTITAWHYYNGIQQKAFDSMVRVFNDTVGKEKGIRVESFARGDITSLTQGVMDAVDKKVGAPKPPNICSAYGDTAYKLYLRELTADIAPYISEEERAGFIDGYLEEGQFAEGELTIFPVAKATEVLVLNRTDWEPFALETGVTLDMLDTYEGIAETAEAYYEWTDALTPEPDDGKAFFGRDAAANYIFVGARQLGMEILDVQDGAGEIHFDRDVVRKLWDNYYVPYVKGYFYKGGRFSSDDMNTGQVAAYIGSSSGVSYVPSEVVRDDNSSYPIEVEILPCPVFEGGEKIATQQGAGMVVLDATPEEVEASVTFLKWFTEGGRNVSFAVSAGYMPVTCDDAAGEALDAELGELPEGVSRQLAELSVKIMRSYTMYSPKAVEGGEDVRTILDNALSGRAKADRKEILLRMEQGMSREEALESFLSDDYFEKWYETTRAEIEAAVKKE